MDSTFLDVHLDSTFLGVHLDSTSLGVHLDSKFWVCTWIARRCRNSSGRLGMGLQEKQLAEVLLVHTSKAVHEQQQSTGHGNLQEKQLLLSEARTRAAGGREVKTGEEELLSMQEPK